ncbi:hypothetical protein Tco_0222809 [Tanacetum coccineum]
MNTRSTGQEPTTPYSKPECFIHHTNKKKKRRKPLIPVENRIPKANYPPFENLFEALVVYNPFLDLLFPMADDQPIWGNNRAVAPTPSTAIIAVDLGDNFTIKATQAILDAGGIFLYKTPNEAHQLLKDPMLLKLNWYNDMKAKPIRKTVSFAESSNESKLMEKMESLTTKINSQFKDIKGEMKEMRDGCNSCGGPHPSSECDDKPMGGPKDEEENYAYGGYRGGGYRGNYYGRSSGNWQDREPRDENRNSQPREDAPFVPPTPEKKFDESDFEKTMREFMVAQKSSHDFVKNQFFNLKTKVKQDLVKKFGRLSDQCSLDQLVHSQVIPKPIQIPVQRMINLTVYPSLGMNM